MAADPTGNPTTQEDRWFVARIVGAIATTLFVGERKIARPAGPPA